MGMSDEDRKKAEELYKNCIAGMEDLKGENPGMENPFLLACNQMFKDFEGVCQEKAEGSAGPTSGGPEDENFMNVLNQFAKDLLSG